jgi:hypothetical protein
MVKVGKQFRRVNGHGHLPQLRTAVERRAAPEAAGPVCDDQTVVAA